MLLLQRDEKEQQTVTAPDTASIATSATSNIGCEAILLHLFL
jgi:hypothetical protein